jgi:hypothetical protein
MIKQYNKPVTVFPLALNLAGNDGGDIALAAGWTILVQITTMNQ